MIIWTVLISFSFFPLFRNTDICSNFNLPACCRIDYWCALTVVIKSHAYTSSSMTKTWCFKQSGLTSTHSCMKFLLKIEAAILRLICLKCLYFVKYLLATFVILFYSVVGAYKLPKSLSFFTPNLRLNINSSLLLSNTLMFFTINFLHEEQSIFFSTDLAR